MTVTEKYILNNSAESLEALKILSDQYGEIGFKDIDQTLILNVARPSIDLGHLEEILHTKFVQRTLIDYLDHPIHIFVLDYCFNDGTNAKVFTNQGLILLAKPICNNAITEIMLHELGHLHNVVKTGDIRLTPRDFYGIVNHDIVRRDVFLQNHWQRTEAKCHYDISREKYADAYMIAGMSLLSGTDVERFITNHINPETKRLFQSYFFKDLI